MGMDAKTAILEQKTALGIEFGSTRIKAVLIGADNAPIASGDHEWENRYDNGVWTYTLEDIWTGLQDAYTKMAADVKEKYDITLTRVGAIGFSAMMHGYMAFDKAGNRLCDNPCRIHSVENDRRACRWCRRGIWNLSNRF